MIQREGLLKEARGQAEQITRQAQAQAEQTTIGADNYAREVLTQLEQTLDQHAASIRKGLEQLK
jgi:hypothetical protein